MGAKRDGRVLDRKELDTGVHRVCIDELKLPRDPRASVQPFCFLMCAYGFQDLDGFTERTTPPNCPCQRKEIKLLLKDFA